MHHKDMHHLVKERPTIPPGLNLPGKIASTMLKVVSPFIHVPAFEVDIVAGDGELPLSDYGIPGRTIYTPGHSWGSLSVLLDSGEVFVGDLAMNLFPVRLKPNLPRFGENIQLIKNSWKKLLDSGAETVYPAHGNPFPAHIIHKLIE